VRRLVVAQFRAIIRARDFLVAGAVGLMLVVAGNLWIGAPFSARGVLGTWLFDADGSLTYGLGVAFVGSVAGVGALSRFDDVLRAKGFSPAQLLASRLVACALLALVIRPAVVVAQLVAGAVDSLVRSGALVFSSPVPINWAQQGKGELRLFGAYVVAAALGAAIALALKNRVASIIVSGAMVALSLPFAGALFERARPLLDALVTLPFTELRAAVSGNAGLFGQSSSYVRQLSPFWGAALCGGWIAVLLCVALLRDGGFLTSRRSIPRVQLAVAAGCVAAAAAGAVLPSALAEAVPWQWRPDWRHARDAGWASDQVAANWVRAVREGGPTSSLLAPGSQIALPESSLEAVEAAAAFSVQSPSALRDPLHVEVALRYSPAIESGNLRVRGGWLGFEFERLDGRYLIKRIFGPSPHQVEVIR
jgi:hypothetical protein